MAKRQSSSQTHSPNYKQLLKESLDEYNDWLISQASKTQDVFKYCIKCRSRKSLPGLKFCKHCNSPQSEARQIQRVKSRRSRATRKKPPKLKICNEPGCTEPYHAKGKCKKHYNTLIKRVIRENKRKRLMLKLEG